MSPFSCKTKTFYDNFLNVATLCDGKKHECISWISYAAEIKVLGQVTHVLQCLETGWQEVDGLAAITTSLFWLCALAYLAFTTFCILFLSSDIDRGVRLVGSHYCRRHKPCSALTQIGPQTLAAHNISSEPFYFRSKIPSQLLVKYCFTWQNFHFRFLHLVNN